MPTLITFTPLQPPARTPVTGKGRTLHHECRDSRGDTHRQRLSLGSIRGVFYLDAVCLHCGAHVVWIEEDSPDLSKYEEAAREVRERHGTKPKLA
jgi:hypothetical protein